MTRPALAVVSAGIGRSSSCRSLADRLAAATRNELECLGTPADTCPVELRDHARDLMDTMLTGFVSPPLRQALDAVAHADAMIAATPIYNASYSGLFKVFFDVLDDGALAGKPVLIAAVGGTARHSLALDHSLRPLFVCLRALVMPTAVYATVDDSAGPDPRRALGDRIRRAAGELARQVRWCATVPGGDPYLAAAPGNRAGASRPLHLAGRQTPAKS